jgi:hypothetical protein
MELASPGGQCDRRNFFRNLALPAYAIAKPDSESTSKAKSKDH